MRKVPANKVKLSKIEAAENAIFSAYCDFAELLGAQEVLNTRFEPGKAPGQWRYRMEPVFRRDPEHGFVLEEQPQSWLELVEAMNRFRVSSEAAQLALPHLSKLMDASAQALPDRWTFRVRMELAEADSIFRMATSTGSLTLDGNRDGTELLKRAPMGKRNMNRLQELYERIRLRLAEVSFATDPKAVWPEARDDVRSRRDKEADELAVKSALGRMLAKDPDRNKITLVRLERESQVPDHAVQQTRAWAEHMEKRRGKGALPSHRKTENPVDAAIDQGDWDAVLRQQEAEKKSRR
jgi:hypothetical protein